jgi:hypothetical protein
MMVSISPSALTAGIEIFFWLCLGFIVYNAYISPTSLSMDHPATSHICPHSWPCLAQVNSGKYAVTGLPRFELVLTETNVAQKLYLFPYDPLPHFISLMCWLRTIFVLGLILNSGSPSSCEVPGSPPQGHCSMQNSTIASLRIHFTVSSHAQGSPVQRKAHG